MAGSASMLEEGEAAGLLLVNKEFYKSVAPIHWQLLVLPLDTVGSYQLGILALRVLPRYGHFVRTLMVSYTYEELGGAAETRELASHIIASHPNLSSLYLLPGLPSVISASPHLASLARLTYKVRHNYDKQEAALATLISRCPNLDFVELQCREVGPVDGQRLVAALASRPALSELRLSKYANWFNDDAANLVNWQSPLDFLTLIYHPTYFDDWDHFHRDPMPVPMSLSGLRTFLSNFTSTLSYLKLDVPLSPPPPPSPLSFTTLVRMEIACPASLSLPTPQDNSPLLSLFIDSQVHTTTLSFGPDHPPSGGVRVVESYLEQCIMLRGTPRGQSLRKLDVVLFGTKVTLPPADFWRIKYYARENGIVLNARQEEVRTGNEEDEDSE